MTFANQCFCGMTMTLGCSNHPKYNSSCPATLPTDADYTFCYTDSFPSTSSSCVGKRINYCGKAGFSLNERYKICKMKSPEPIQMVLNVMTDSSDLKLSYKNTNDPYTSEDGSISIKINELDTMEQNYNDFVMWDKPSNDFYYLPSQYVNEKNEHNPGKLGYWVVDKSSASVNRTVGVNPGGLNWIPLTVDVTDCNTITKTPNYALTTNLLSTLQQYNVNAKKLQIFLSDQEYSPSIFKTYSSAFDNYRDYWFLKDGIISFKKDSPSLLSFVGMTLSGDLVPIQSQTVSSLKVKLNDGSVSFLRNPQLRCVFYSDYTTSDPCTQVCVVSSHSNSSLYGMCRLSGCNFDETKLECVDPVISVLTWPDLRKTECYFDRKFVCKKMDTINSTSTLVLNVPQAMVSMDVTLRNLSINFRYYDIVPVISDCSYSAINGNLTFYLNTNGGEAGAVVMFSNPLIPALSPILTTQRKMYTIRTDERINEEVIISVVNGMLRSSCSVVVSKSYGKALDDFWMNVNASNVVDSFFNLLGMNYQGPTWPKVVFFYSMVASVVVSGVVTTAVAGFIVYWMILMCTQ